VLGLEVLGAGASVEGSTKEIDCSGVHHSRSSG
jgi:hypothetical protein